MIKQGYYKFMGNTVEYWGGQFAHDIDSGEEIPAETAEKIFHFYLRKGV